MYLPNDIDDFTKWAYWMYEAKNCCPEELGKAPSICKVECVRCYEKGRFKRDV